MKHLFIGGSKDGQDLDADGKLPIRTSSNEVYYPRLLAEGRQEPESGEPDRPKFHTVYVRDCDAHRAMEMLIAAYRQK